jgi:acylphosphatase
VKGKWIRVKIKGGLVGGITTWPKRNDDERVVVLLQGPIKTLEGLRQLFRQMPIDWNSRLFIVVEVLTPKMGRMEDEKRGKKRKYGSGLGTEEGEVTSLWISHGMVGGVVD